jgi:hypothetical protein
MEFDIKVRSRFVKRSMDRRRDNPLSIFSMHIREEMEAKRTFPAQKYPLRRVPSRDAS